MITFVECIPCFLKQALATARQCNAGPQVTKRIVDRVCALIPRFSMRNPPPVFARELYRIVAEETGNHDPFADVKRKSTRKALRLYSKLKKRVRHSRDPLREAIVLAAVGNVIDMGVGKAFDIERELRKASSSQFSAFDYGKFRQKLSRAGEILFIADNAGETVFDRILIEELTAKRPGLAVGYAVRSKPAINDATMEDARQAGLGGKARLIESGADLPGIIISLATKDFRKALRRADFIISKGQGNFETLSEVKKPVFFILKAKCPVVSRFLRVPENTLILKYRG